jgi:hypothetical protein
VKELADKWCSAKGLVLAKFIEDAILDKLEEHQDIAEIDALRREPTRPFREVLPELKVSSSRTKASSRKASSRKS